LTDSDFSGATLLETYFSGANLTNADLSGADLTTTNCDRANLTAANLSGANLSYVDFDDANLTTADFSKANLTDADFEDSTLTDANFSGAIVIGAEFGDATNGGFTAAQLYSTASYQAGDLRRIGLDGSDLTGWNFAGKNLTDARFYYANLTNVNLSGANLTGTGFLHANLTDADLGGATLTDAGLSFCDLRGATILPSQISSAASTEDAILPDGRIEGLALDAGERLVVRDHELPITVESGMSLDPTQQTRMIFEDDDWGSTISFEPGIEVSLDGALSLILADDVRPADLIGTTFDLFDWDGAIVTGQFDRIGAEPGVIWDTSRLYSTGQVTLVPEPSTFILLLIALMGYALRRRKS
jgi:uncharacterized protein YjbI with pentapeptide repeats